MNGALPPSSRCTRFSVSAEFAAISLPVAVSPVRETIPTSGLRTIVSPTGREKTGYPTQKPEGLLRRFVQASSRPGDMCMDPFAGSGTLGAVAASLGRRYLLMDSSPQAVGVATQRLRQDGDPGLL